MSTEERVAALEAGVKALTDGQAELKGMLAASLAASRKNEEALGLSKNLLAEVLPIIASNGEARGEGTELNRQVATLIQGKINDNIASIHGEISACVGECKETQVKLDALIRAQLAENDAETAEAAATVETERARLNAETQAAELASKTAAAKRAWVGGGLGRVWGFFEQHFNKLPWLLVPGGSAATWWFSQPNTEALEVVAPIVVEESIEEPNAEP